MLKYVLLSLLILSSCAAHTVVEKRDTSRAEGIVGLHVAFLTKKKVWFGENSPQFSDDAKNWDIENVLEEAVKDSLDTTNKALRRFAVSTDPADIKYFDRGLQIGDALLVIEENGIRMMSGENYQAVGFLLHDRPLSWVQIEPFGMFRMSLFYPGECSPNGVVYNTKWVDGECGPFITGIPARKALKDITKEEKETLRIALRQRLRNTVNALMTDLGLAKRF
jgi:hypothetical protein